MALEPLEKRRGSESRESGGGCSRHRGLSAPNKSSRKRHDPFEPFEKRRGSGSRESGGVYSRHRRLSVPNEKVAAKGMALEPLEKRRGFESRESSRICNFYRGLSAPNKSSCKGYGTFCHLSWRGFLSTRFIVIGSPESPFEARAPYEKGRRSLAVARFCVPAFAQSVF